MKSELLNTNLCIELRNTITETDIFVKDKLESEIYYLTCAIMDRLDTSINYINNHLELPKNDDELILFMVHSCIIKDAINMLLKKLNLENINTDFFKDICSKTPFLIEANEYKGDDKFFEYIRSLIFAHPFVTDRSIFVKKDEVQYSPYILVDSYGAFIEDKDTIGAMVYSNQQEMFFINLKFEVLKEYLKNKFNVLDIIIKKFKQIIKEKEDVWKLHKVNRNLNNTYLLKDMIDVLNERYIDSSRIQEMLSYYTCEISNISNSELIEKYRKIIEQSLPRMSDALDDYDHEKLFLIIDPIINIKIKELYPMMHYQLEKIYSYLNNDYGDTSWGLKQAELFSNQFAKKWVTIEPYTMSFDEIKLLTTIACYYENKEVGENK